MDTWVGRERKRKEVERKREEYKEMNNRVTTNCSMEEKNVLRQTK